MIFADIIMRFHVNGFYFWKHILIILDLYANMGLIDYAVEQ